jgi:predicted dehydrogenase
MKKTYQVGVIGAGARAETFARRLYSAASSCARLFGICDIDEDRLRKFCDYCGIKNTRLFTDPNELFRQPEMDAVIIATPEFAHRECALAAIAANKHFYLEKAMAPTSEDCRAIIRAHRRSKVVAYLGFNMRQTNLHRRIKQVVDSGVLGQIVHVSGLEQLSIPHSASFMRRFHRHSERSGGFLNTKCSHDLDFMQWFVGHEHRVSKVASFGGTNVFLPKHGPKGHGARCSECPKEIFRACPYRDQAGFVFPVRGKTPIHKTRETGLYGGDLCVYHDDKDIVDNQTVIWEWDHGVRGNFNLQLFQRHGLRETHIWGEFGRLDASTADNHVRVTISRTGRVIEHDAKPSPGGHGGSDTRMLGQFVKAMDSGKSPESGLEAGLAATLLAEKADQSRLMGKVVTISPSEYW